MQDSVIWMRVDAVPPHGSLAELHRVRTEAGADVMYPRRFAQARALAVGDRVVVHYGGRKRSDSKAQRLVQGGWVGEEARPITQEDERERAALMRVSRRVWEKEGDLAGIIFYDLLDPPSEVGLLPSPRRPRTGNNFIRLERGSPGYDEANEWWHQITRRGHQATASRPTREL